MPDTVTNGYTNGHGHMPYDMEDGSSFLFTSESVGEGHPGNFCFDEPDRVTGCRHMTARHAMLIVLVPGKRGPPSLT